MPNSHQYVLDWHAGASAQLEFYSPLGEKSDDNYQLKYTPPFRTTMRLAPEPRRIGPAELEDVNRPLNEVISNLTLESARGDADGNGAGAPQMGLLDRMTDVGQEMMNFLLPMQVARELSAAPSLFIEVGVDRALLDYPWELMHDGEDFLCLKHRVGRFVNITTGSAGPEPLRLELFNKAGSNLDRLRILIVSAPNPESREGIDYERLPDADAETRAINEVTKSLPGVEIVELSGDTATYDNVRAAARNGPYQIVHFNGHAHFDAATPAKSALVLHNRDISTRMLAAIFERTPPMLCFINGCETLRTAEWKDSYDVFGIGYEFLRTGAYVLGSRWKIGDVAAAEFARTFYSSLLSDRDSIGAAIRHARLACKSDDYPDDIAWASYVFYGDPRLCFRAQPRTIDLSDEPTRTAVGQS